MQWTFSGSSVFHVEIGWVDLEKERRAAKLIPATSDIQSYANRLARRVLLYALIPIVLIMSMMTAVFVERSTVGEQLSIIEAIQENLLTAVQIGDTFQITKLSSSLLRSRVLSGFRVSVGKTVVSNSGTFPVQLDERIAEPGLHFINRSLHSIQVRRIRQDSAGQEIVIESAKEIPLKSLVFLATVFAVGFGICAIALKSGLSKMATELSAPIRSLAEHVSRDVPSQLSSKSEVTFQFREIMEIWQRHLEFVGQTKVFLAEMSRLRVSEAIARTTQALAHDVRKPFSMFKMIIDMIECMDDPNEVKELLVESLPDVQQAMASVNGMIQDVLEVGSHSKPIREPACPESLIESALTEIFRVYPLSKVHFQYEFSHTHKLSVDILKINRVLSNIIGNAAQAMNFQGLMWFKTRELNQNNLIEFCIGNEGSFIPPESLPKLFDAFFTEGKKSGTGLGLAIARKVVQAHGGEIWCVSGKNDKFLKGYVEFFFTLPKDDVPIGTQSDLLPKDSQEILLTLEKFRIQNSNQGLKTDAEEIQLETEILQLLRKPVTILVLDDEAVYRNALLSLISKSENLKKLISIHAVQHSSDAIDFAQGMNPILAILDIDLGPGSISGLETAMELRKVGYLNRICIHSNRFFADDFKKAMEVGANSVLPKPMTRAHFLKAILEALS